MEETVSHSIDITTILTGISIIIAGYAAVVSTILGIRELKREKRKLSIILDYIPFYETVNLVLVNSGHRPITIMSIGMEVFEENDGVNQPHWDVVPGNAMFKVACELPVYIEDGKSAVFPLSNVVSNILISNQINNQMRARISVMDAEGKVYSKYKTVETNPREEAINNPQ